MYFKNFKQLTFLITPPGYKRPAEYANLVDITTNVRFKKEVLDNIILFDLYSVKDSDTLETISEELYGSPHYNWVLMLLNDIYDYRRDFVMNEEVFERYIIDKYGSVENAKRTIKYYIDDAGNVVGDIPDPITGYSGYSGYSGSPYEYNYNMMTQALAGGYTGPLLDEQGNPSTELYEYFFGVNTMNALNSAGGFEYADTIGSPVYAYEYEVKLNEDKRNIKVISKELLTLVLKNFNELM